MLAGFRDDHAVPASGLHVRGGAVHDRFGPCVLALVVRAIDRLRGEGPDLRVLPRRHRLAGFSEMAFRIVDGSTTLFRVPHTRSGFVEDSLEDPFPPLVERPDGDPPQEAFRGHVMASGREPAGAFDVPLERERLDAGLLRPLEDGVRVTQGLCHARLPLRNFERTPRSAREVEGAAEVPGGLRLLRPVDEAPRERRVRGIPARCEEVFAGRVDGPLHEVRSGSGGHRPIERLAARIAARPPVRHVRFAQRAACHVAPTERMPSASGGNDPFECRVSRYK